MKRTMKLLSALLAAVAILPSITLAAPVSLADQPLANGTTSVVRPNLMFVLDDSGSMSQDYTPDYINDTTGTAQSYAMCWGVSGTGVLRDTNQAAQCTVYSDMPWSASDINYQHYNPASLYKAPVRADGTSYPDSTPTAAKTDGYGIFSALTADLTTSWQHKVWCKNVTDLPTAIDPSYSGNCLENTDTTNNNLLPSTTYPYARTYNAAPYHYSMSPFEYCTDSTRTNCVLSTTSTTVSGVSYNEPSLYRWCASYSTVTHTFSGCQGRRDQTHFIPNYLGGFSTSTAAVKASANIVVNASNAAGLKLTGLTINGTSILVGGTTITVLGTDTSTTLAQKICTVVNANTGVSGYGCPTVPSTSAVMITANIAGSTPNGFPVFISGPPGVIAVYSVGSLTVTDATTGKVINQISIQGVNLLSSTLSATGSIGSTAAAICNAIKSGPATTTYNVRSGGSTTWGSCGSVSGLVEIQRKTADTVDNGQAINVTGPAAVAGVSPTGTITINPTVGLTRINDITVNGTSVLTSKPVNFADGTFTSSIASTLAGLIGSGYTGSAVGNVVTITKTTLGTTGNGYAIVVTGGSVAGVVGVSPTATLNISKATVSGALYTVTVKAGTGSSCTSATTLATITSVNPLYTNNPGNSCASCTTGGTPAGSDCKRAVNVANALFAGFASPPSWSDSQTTCLASNGGGRIIYTAPVGTAFNGKNLCLTVSTTGGGALTPTTGSPTTFSNTGVNPVTAVNPQGNSTSGTMSGGVNAVPGTIGLSTTNMSNGAALSGTIATTATTPAVLLMSGGVDALSASRSGVGIFKRTDIVPSTTTYAKSTKRTDCTATTCTYAQELQNFANWYTYYRTRINMMKTTSTQAFSALDGSKYRIGFDKLSNSGANSVVTPVGQFLDSGEVTNQRSNWWTALTNATTPVATPLRAETAKIGRYFAGKLSTDPLLYSCQQNFMLLVTDGYWNEAESTAIKGIDGTVIGNVDNDSATSASPPPYYDGQSAPSACPATGAGTRAGFSSCRTLADVTRYYYVNDLRDATLWNNAISNANSTDVSENDVRTSTGDSNTKQHMVFFAMGLGVDGTLQFKPDYLTAGSGDYYDILHGTRNWPSVANLDPTAVDDLWHAAVNAHGQYFSARDPSSVSAGLSSALSKIQAVVGAASAAATSNLQPVAGDNFAYVASYETVTWVGDLQSRAINLTSGAVSSDTNCGVTGSGCLWSAQTQLDTQLWSSRNIYIKPTSGATGSALRPFIYTNLSATEQAYFNPSSLNQYSSTNTNFTANGLVDFLRGDRSMEANGGSQPQIWRSRVHVLGDIVNSQPVYVKAPSFTYLEGLNPGYTAFRNGAAKLRQAMVYVSANDGMLHTFNATTGVEAWAYIPTQVLPAIKILADTSYNHKFFVDGPTTVGDVNFGGGSSDWHTIIVAGLGAGGKAYVALDITDPLNPKYLWEFTTANLGYTFSNPSINKLPTGEWAVLFTSGYNNTAGDGGGHLYALNPSTGAILSGYPLNTGSGSAATPSNLGKISAWVDNLSSDNTATYVYSGDLDGDLWRFDLTARSVFELAHLANGSGQSQPITTRPELALAGSTRVVYVGTGQYLGDPDRSTTQVQSLYAIKDTLGASNLGNGSQETWHPRTDTATIGGIPNTNLFLQRKLLQAYDDSTPITDGDGDGTDGDGNLIRKVCAGASSQFSHSTYTCTNETGTSMDWTTYGGWFIDFPDTGERMNVDLNLALGTLVFGTNVPASNACTAGGYSWLNFVDYNTGLAVDAATAFAGIRLANALIVGLNTIKLSDSKVATIVTTSDYKHTSVPPPVKPSIFQGKRSLWREFEAY